MPDHARDVVSVGIDIGTTTTQTVFSQLTIWDVARPGQVPRIQVEDKSLLYQSEIHPTPLLNETRIDAETLATIVQRDYDHARIGASEIESGAIIITGEAARSENAEEILDALSSLAGDFVVTVAGPNAEAHIAGRGAGVARWSTDHYQQVTSVDVGGGTSNAAIFRRGRHLASSAAAIGGRLIEIDAEGCITAIAPPGHVIARSAGVTLQIGEIATFTDLQTLCDVMANKIVDLIAGMAIELPDIQLTPPLDDAWHSTAVFLTGGVGDCYYAAAPVESLKDVCRFGDLGPLLADSLRRNSKFAQLNVLEPPETIHATVMGAASQTVTLSGSTIWADASLLPLRNLPVLRPNSNDVADFTEGVEAARTRWDLNADTLVAIVVDIPENVTFSNLNKLATEIVSYHFSSGVRPPLILIMAGDYAKVLGQAIKAIDADISLLVIDQVGLGEGDFIDIGQPMLDGRAVPLSIKTLVFYD